MPSIFKQKFLFIVIGTWLDGTVGPMEINLLFFHIPWTAGDGGSVPFLVVCATLCPT